MLRNSKIHYKSSDLFSVLREHFVKDMNLARIKAMSMMICALCKVQRIAYTKLAAAFDNEAEACSSLRRIQRLIAECVINTDLIAKLILKLIPVKGPYSLSMDRTNWKFSDTNINILTLGIIHEGMTFPIVFKMMDKRVIPTLRSEWNLFPGSFDLLVITASPILWPIESLQEVTGSLF